MPLTRRHLQIASVGAALGSLLDFVPAHAATADSTSEHQAKIVNLDDRVTFAQQLEHNVGPVVLMSTFLVAPEHVDEFLEGFKKQFAIMRKAAGSDIGTSSSWYRRKQLIYELYRVGDGRCLQACAG